MRTLLMMTVALGVAACSSGNKSSPIKKVSAMGMATQGIATDGNQHVAYLLNGTAAYGATGELHVATADGKDTKIAASIAAGAYYLSSDGKGMLFAAANSGGDASLNWVDLSNPAAAPKQVFAGGLQQQPITAGTMTPTFTTPLLQQGFVSPSGRFYVVGVLAANVAVSPDMHVIDVDTGNDVFQRGNGAFDYLELVLPNDVMVFQDAVGGNGGVAGGPGLQTLFWVDLTSGTPTPTAIDTRTGAYSATGDDKSIVYANADRRELYVWDAVARPATGTKVASNALTFAVGTSGPIAYLGTDGSMHVVKLDGTAVADIDAATAKADLFSPVFISDDGADVYYFQEVHTQDGQGTLMHLSATAGATPVKVADSASLTDVHALPGGVLLYVADVDSVGGFGSAFKSARDGSGATMIGAQVPVGFLSVTRPTDTTSSMWVSTYLSGAAEDKNKHLVDGVRAIVGGLEVTTPSGHTTIGAGQPMTRLGQYQVSDDLSSLVYVTSGVYDSTVDNFVGSLEQAPVASPTMTPAMPLLTGVSEVGSVVKKSLFVNAPKASSPGVYFVSF